jgi:hypothetical protein
VFVSSLLLCGLFGQKMVRALHTTRQGSSGCASAAQLFAVLATSSLQQLHHLNTSNKDVHASVMGTTPLTLLLLFMHLQRA